MSVVPDALWPLRDRIDYLDADDIVEIMIRREKRSIDRAQYSAVQSAERRWERLVSGAQVRLSIRERVKLALRVMRPW